VSVVIPCYRYGRFLPDCVQSVLGQNDVDVRVLIIDDASPDDSAQVARDLAASDDRVEVRVHPENRGHIATYNEGLLGWADGDYSILISADDLLTPGSVARATAVMEANPDVGFVYGHALKWCDSEPRPAPRLESTGLTVWPGMEWLRIVCLLGHSVVTAPEVVVRTSVQQQIGGYLPSLPHTGDLEMWMRFAVHADVAYLRGVDQALYRSHGANMTVERNPLVDLQQRQAAFDAVFETFPDLPEREYLQGRSGRRMAKEALWEGCRAYHRKPGNAELADELLGLARGMYPRCEALPEYWGLRWRRRAGPQVSASLRPLMVSAVRRRIRTRLWFRHWRSEGV
jgi:hypothetical protein